MLYRKLFTICTFALCILFSLNINAALFTALPDNASTSANARAPQGAVRYNRTVYLITAAELSASGFTNGMDINAIGFVYQTGQSIPTTGAFKVYLENTTDAAYSKPSTTWTNGTNGVIDNMTLVSDGTITIPATAGNFDIPFVNGNPFTYTGGALYVAFDYANPSGTVAAGANVALCNNTLAGNLWNAFNNTQPSAVTGSSAFRPTTRLGTPFLNDAAVNDIYTLGELPLIFATPHQVQARVTNNADNTLTNLNVTLNITGANTFTDVQIIPSLASGASTIVTFAGYTPASTGINNITVDVPADNNNTNNQALATQNVNNDLFNYSNGNTATSSIGFNTGGGILATKYTTTTPTYITDVNVFISNTATNVGNTVSGIVLNSAGVIVGQSAPYVIANGDLGTYVTFPITVPPAFANTFFYAGLLQTPNAITGYFPVGTQTEATPTRPDAYFSFPVAGGVATNYTNLGRFMIGATVTTVPLSSDILSLTATPEQNDAVLTWKSNKQDVQHFVVERSADMKNFTAAGNVEASYADTRSMEYSYSHRDIGAGAFAPTYYYRVKQITTDGRSNYSPVVTVNFKGNATFNALAVNPVRDNVQLSITTTAESDIQITVSDMHGKLIYKGSKACVKGANIVTLNDCNLKHAGTYIITVSDGKNTISQKLVKE